MYSNVLFAVKRVLHDYHVSHPSQMKRLVHITEFFVTQRVPIDWEEIQWLVCYAYLMVIRNAPSYRITTRFLYRKVIHSPLRDKLLPITQHPSVQPIIKCYCLFQKGKKS